MGCAYIGMIAVEVVLSCVHWVCAAPVAKYCCWSKHDDAAAGLAATTVEYDVAGNELLDELGVGVA